MSLNFSPRKICLRQNKRHLRTRLIQAGAQARLSVKDVILLKKQSDFSRLMSCAGNYRYFTYASWVLSAASALTALVPFLYIWKILRDVLNAAPNYAQAVNIPHYGWMAVLFAVLEPKDTAVYKLITTKPGEAASEG